MGAKTPMDWVANWIRVKTQSSHPASPASGYGAFYDKDKAPYFKNSDGLELDLTPSAGVSYGQTHNYPTVFTGDTINGSSAAPFVDVAAFDTKEVLNSRILHLVTKGASKDQKVRVTLNTPKAGAFDVTVCVTYFNVVWSTNGDTYADVLLTTAAGAAQICGMRTAAVQSSSPYISQLYTRAGGSTFPSILSTTIDGRSLPGQGFTVRFVRDESNVISFYFGQGTAPMALCTMVDNYCVPLAPVVSGTLACIEFAQHSPAGPPSGTIADTFIDYIESV